MNIDNEYLDFLNIFNKYQDENKFSSEHYQFFLCGLEDSESKNLLISNISDIAMKYEKKSFILDSSTEFKKFIENFRKKDVHNFKNEIYFINLFENNESVDIFSQLKSAEYDLTKNNFRMVLTYNLEQLQTEISRSNIYQFRTRTFFDDEGLIQKYNLLINLDKELPFNQEKIKKNKI